MNGRKTLDSLRNAAGAGLFGILLAVVVAILAIIWTNQAYKSAMSRGVTGNKWSSGWAVGGWFIPFANYVIPKLVINEIDRMSRTELSEPITDTWKPLVASPAPPEG